MFNSTTGLMQFSKKHKHETFILLFPVSNFDRVDDVERGFDGLHIENVEQESEFINAVCGMGVRVYSVYDFATLANDQCFEPVEVTGLEAEDTLLISDYWVGHVTRSNDLADNTFFQ